MSDDGVVEEVQRRRGKEKQRLFAGKKIMVVCSDVLYSFSSFFFLFSPSPGSWSSPSFIGGKGSGAAWAFGRRGEQDSAGRLVGERG